MRYLEQSKSQRQQVGVGVVGGWRWEEWGSPVSWVWSFSLGRRAVLELDGTMVVQQYEWTLCLEIVQM